MLRKRSRSHQKDQYMGHLMSDATSESYLQSDVLGQKHKSNSFFTVSGLFVGLSSKGLSDSDSVRSPTSPLDFRVFSNLGNPFRSPKSSSHDGQHHKTWDCTKVGLSIIDSLDEDVKLSGKVLRSSESKNILFGPQTRINNPKIPNNVNSFESPKSLPINYAIFPHTQTKSPHKIQDGNSDVLFGIGEAPGESEAFGKTRSCSYDSARSLSSIAGLINRSFNSSNRNFWSEHTTTQVGGSPTESSRVNPNLGKASSLKVTSVPLSIGSDHGFIGSLSASEIELSEDYTCVITHGPNPKTTHIYGDCILECHPNDIHVANSSKQEDAEWRSNLSSSAQHPQFSSSYPLSNFLSFCYSCKKKLDGEDIYIYRGEKAFCSCGCRSQEILIDEETKDTTDDSFESSPEPDSNDDVFQTGIFIAT
ncbi:Zf-FLZ domain [Dillenia turbinata]|uniref:Zf-FLZ domain n=1 Tax=Dillenia turbinata TaxID=194707 RepID=A0AAN8UH81_9MAGN